MDEQLLTGSRDVSISKDKEGKWHIRDYGRGIRYQHLTQKENEEKLRSPHTIGKFGIGLKDALATFDRKGAKVLIRSRFGDIVLGKAEKHGFEDIVTLHAHVAPPSDSELVGTDIVLDRVSQTDIEKAKALFLRYSGEREIEETKYGQVLGKGAEVGRIYINGVRVAEEENFLFSYNITSLTKAIRKSLNRERSNVGRTAYAGRVKSILLECETKEVAELLVDDLRGFESGEMHDELRWLDVQERAVKILNARKRVVFLTPEEMASETMMVDEAKQAGHEIVAIPENLKARLSGLTDIYGSPVRDLVQFKIEYDESFEFEFVEPSDLDESERAVFETTDDIFRLIGGKPKKVKQVLISDTMRKQLGTFIEAQGVWEPEKGRIVVKRTSLKNLTNYAGTLLHEVAHATSGAADVTRHFEQGLTELLGTIAARAVRRP